MLLILNINFAIENKTQTQQNKYSVTGNFCSYLDLNTAGENWIVFISLRRNFRLMHAVLLRRAELLLEYNVSQLSVELAEGRYTSLSDIISRVFQRWLIQNYKRCERFVSVNWEFSQFSTSSPANSLPVHGTLLTLWLPDQICNSPYCQIYNFFNISS